MPPDQARMRRNDRRRARDPWCGDVITELKPDGATVIATEIVESSGRDIQSWRDALEHRGVIIRI